jgi:hypothetical protein
MIEYLCFLIPQNKLLSQTILVEETDKHVIRCPMFSLSALPHNITEKIGPDFSYNNKLQSSMNINYNKSFNQYGNIQQDKWNKQISLSKIVLACLTHHYVLLMYYYSFHEHFFIFSCP